MIVFYLLLFIQKVPVCDWEARKEKNIKQEIIPNRFIDTCFPSKQNFPENPQTFNCCHLQQERLTCKCLLHDFLRSYLWGIRICHFKSFLKQCQCWFNMVCNARPDKLLQFSNLIRYCFFSEVFLNYCQGDHPLLFVA